MKDALLSGEKLWLDEKVEIYETEYIRHYLDTYEILIGGEVQQRYVLRSVLKSKDKYIGSYNMTEREVLEEFDVELPEKSSRVGKSKEELILMEARK